MMMSSSRSFVAPNSNNLQILLLIQSSSCGWSWNWNWRSSSNSSYIHNNSKLISPIPSSSSAAAAAYSWMISRRHNMTHKSCRDFAVVHSALDPSGAGAGPPPPHSNWKSWVIGMAATLILPFLRHKFGPLLLLTNRVEKVVEKAEAVAEMIEKAAETVEKVAEEISDDLPEGGKLRDAVDFIETLAKETAKDAHFVDNFIDQVQDVEDVVENIIHDNGSQKDDDANGNNN